MLYAVADWTRRMPRNQPDPDFRAAFSERLRKLRTQRGWTQKELAEKVGIPTYQVNKYEGGHNAPQPETLLLLAESLDTTTDYLLSGIAPDPSELRDRQILERFKAVQELSPSNQTAILAVIDAMVAKERTEAAMRPLTPPTAVTRPRRVARAAS